MLLRNVFVKSLLDHRRGLAWWMLGVVLLCAAMTSFYPSISTNDAVQDYLDSYDPDLLAIFGFSEHMDITTGPGYPDAASFMQRVAEAGRGQFVRADENASLSVTILRAVFDG